jgi:hypothetical protein
VVFVPTEIGGELHVVPAERSNTVKSATPPKIFLAFDNRMI